MRRTRKDGKVVCDTFADVREGERAMWLAHESERKPRTFVKTGDCTTKFDNGALGAVMDEHAPDKLLVVDRLVDMEIDMESQEEEGE